MKSLIAVLSIVFGLGSIQPSLAKAPLPPPIKLTIKSGQLHYHYDLSGMFDKVLWRMLNKNRHNEITIEVRLIDQSNKPLVTHFHQLGITLIKNGRLKVNGLGAKSTIYHSRAHLVRSLRNVPGRPIEASKFKGRRGHLEVIVRVNPVKVYAFPPDNGKVARNKVTLRTYADRTYELRSPAVSP